MAKPWIAAACVFLIATLSPPSQAGVRDWGLDAGLFLGDYTSIEESSRSVNSAAVLGGRVGVNLPHHIGLELEIGHVLSETRDLGNYQLNVLYQIVNDRFVTFVTAGAGLALGLSEDEYEKNTLGLLYGAGVGFKLYLTHWAAVRADVRYLGTTAFLGHHFQLSVGAVFSFLGTAPDRRKSR